MGKCMQSYLEPLFRLQKKIIRIICGVKPGEHSDDLFLKLCLNLEKINTHLVSRLMFKIHHKIVTMFDDFFVRNDDVHSYATRQSNHYHIPLCRKNIGKASFRYTGAVTWNAILNQEIDLNVSDYLFARNVKCVIFQDLL